MTFRLPVQSLHKARRADQIFLCIRREIFLTDSLWLMCVALWLKNKRRDEMRRTTVVLIVLIGSVGALNLATPARAASYPVCLAAGSDNALRCNYASFEECRATASGGLGYCVRNPESFLDAYASFRR
jgi:hypothetical protein